MVPPPKPTPRPTPLRPEELAWSCEALHCPVEGPAHGVLIGQQRAIDAMRLGLEVYAPGYNVFVSGVTGTRRAQGVMELIGTIRATCRVVPDRVFVHNFAEPHRPALVTLPRGQGPRFAAELERLARALMTMLATALSSPALAERRQAVQKEYASKEQLLFHDLAAECQAAGLALVQLGEEGQAYADIFPRIDDKAVPPEALEVLVREGKLDAAKAEELQAARKRLVTKLYEIRSHGQELALAMMGVLEELERDAAQRVVASLIAGLREKFAQPEIAGYFDALAEFAVARAGYIAGYRGAAQAAGLEGERVPRELEVFAVPRGAPHAGEHQEEDCPVVFEANPTLGTLFGTILPPEQDGPRVSHIEVGALLRADGGYLVLRLADIVEQNGVWPALKRVLKSGLLEIRSAEVGGMVPASPLRPDPIEVQPKVVLIGEPGSYELLSREDPEFRKVFKVHAQFDTTMENTEANRCLYASFGQGLAEREALRAATPDGLARLTEYGARLAGSQRRLTTRFGDLADVYREAAWHAGRRGAAQIEREDVIAAERQRTARLSLVVEKYLESVRDGRYRLETSGAQVGQLNGLVVLDTGALIWGRPSRLTAQVGVGHRGVIDIERESELSGPLHLKGVQILSGYLLGMFAGTTPLRLSATLCFEQSYAGIDGDSASSTELYVILSALAQVPLQQGLAVTGSVDQFGRVQAVGGINEKVEGWFEVCKQRGLSGEQGVVLPSANADSLMLMPEVVEAVRERRFHVYAIDHIAEGLEILSGMPAGTASAGETTVLGRAAARLQEFARAWQANAGHAPR